MNNDNLLSKLTEYIKTKLNGGKEENKNDKNKRSDKMIGNLVLVVLVAVVIVLASSFFKSPKVTTLAGTTETEADKASKESSAIKTDDYEAQLEGKLKLTLEGIEGVGKVQLMIYFESSQESVPAVNVTDSKSLTVENDTTGGKRNINQENNGSTVVMSNNGDENKPLIVKTYKPVITGVCVVAEGSGVKITELRIRQAVINLFNLPESKVNVYPMNK
jgi:stage III sporulation protein AG